VSDGAGSGTPPLRPRTDPVALIRSVIGAFTRR